MAANYYPDGLTIEVITALEHEVDEELQREGYPAQPVVSAPTWMPPRRTRRRRNGRSSSRTGNSPTPSPPTVDAPAPQPRPVPRTTRTPGRRRRGLQSRFEVTDDSAEKEKPKTTRPT
jgi:hypothetical protein